MTGPCGARESCACELAAIKRMAHIRKPKRMRWITYSGALARAGWLPEKKGARPRRHPGASRVTIGPPPMGGAVIMSLVESRRKLV
jgi:hypothetical protein